MTLLRSNIVRPVAVAHLKRTPVPVPGRTRRHRALYALFRLAPPDPNGWSPRQGRHIRAYAVLPRSARVVPPPVLFPAVLARSRFCAVRVELCVLVERDRVVGVRVAEDMATVAAVVTPLEEAECLLTDGRVANDSVGVRFPVGACGEALHFAHGLFRDWLF